MYLLQYVTLHTLLSTVYFCAWNTPPFPWFCPAMALHPVRIFFFIGSVPAHSVALNAWTGQQRRVVGWKTCSLHCLLCVFSAFCWPCMDYRGDIGGLDPNFHFFFSLCLLEPRGWGATLSPPTHPTNNVMHRKKRKISFSFWSWMIRFLFGISQAETNVGLYICTRPIVFIVKKRKIQSHNKKKDRK